MCLAKHAKIVVQSHVTIYLYHVICVWIESAFLAGKHVLQEVTRRACSLRRCTSILGRVQGG